jgi:hypothetical protein
MELVNSLFFLVNTFRSMKDVRWCLDCHGAYRRSDGRARPDGIRMERRILKLLKATTERNDMSLGDLLEGIVLHALKENLHLAQKL